MSDFDKDDVREALEAGHRDIVDIVKYVVDRPYDEDYSDVIRMIGRIEGEENEEYGVVL